MSIAEQRRVLGDTLALAKAQSRLERVQANLDRVQIFKHVLEQCVALMAAALNGETEDHDFVEAAALTERLDTKVSEWASLGPLQTFLRRNETKESIHGLLQELPTSDYLAPDVMLDRENAEIRDLLQAVVSSKDEMQMLLSTESEEPLCEVMEALQTNLHDAHLIDPEPTRSSFTKALRFLYEETDKLPPLVDLSGQVTFDASDRQIGSIFPGEWLGTEKVELRIPPRPVLSGSSPDLRKRFERAARRWRDLKHTNILSFYGIVYSGQDLYTVQPWMDNRTALEFLWTNPDVDRLKILSEIASGLEYLHKANVVHGDLRGTNVLFDKNGSALLSGFGIANLTEDGYNGIASSDMANPRWCAPELFRNNSSPSKQSDVWSFAMVSLELMTGQPPYNNIPRDIAVLHELEQGKIPARPGRVATDRGLSDDLWAFMRKCWHKKPDSRPSATAATRKLLQLRGLGLAVKKRSFFRRPATADGFSSSSSGNLTLSIPSRPTSPSSAELHPPSTAKSLGHRRQSSTGTVDSPDGGPSHSPSFHSDRSESQVYFGRRSGNLPLSSADRSTPTLLPDTDSDLQSPASGSSQYSLPDSLMLLDNPASGDVYTVTLKGLVDKLLSPVSFPNAHKRSEFQEVLFSTCHEFTTPQNLLGMILQHFHTEPPQLNVFAVLTFWVSRHRLQINPQLLSQIKQFCLTVIPAKTSSVDASARNLFRLAEERSTLMTVPPVPPTPTRIPRTADILPRDLAIALTLLEGDSYWSILPADYLSHLNKVNDASKGPNRVNDASTENNKIVLWVKKSILTPSRVETRAEVFKFFVNTAHECWKMRNFESLSAITTALQSTEERLTLTVGALSSHLRDMLQDLKNLLDPSNNHLTYRAALKPEEALDPQYRNFCIPWLAVHLRDLNSLLRNYPPTLEIDGCTLINFRRYSKFMEHIRALHLLKPPDLERYRASGQLAYLQHQLRGVHFDPDTDAALMQRSLELEADETRIHRTRALELKRLGFRS
ncbi:ras guanine nucleotide exchange factor domain-containing protein [Mycena alexandri]|uniref:Ras guanine nucleotide exchange factor domain-containing protein n=1 Tax=Mycena alexandri TaxID=1745969 RepID=A0AAD6THV0_9AGAR|nr:ras guanine nucleotide exchange factor domain-containing protein [Mycena alexandri]